MVGVTPEIEALAGGAGSDRGTGGMATKLKAARLCGDLGIPCAVIAGDDRENLYRLMAGEAVGTLFLPPEPGGERSETV